MMTNKEMERLTAHFDRFFTQSDSLVLHPTGMEPHIDVLLYEPTEALPFWKMVSMGASDFRMPVKKPALGDRNEYIMFIPREENLTDKSVAERYWRYLMRVAHYPISRNCYITYGHCIEWDPSEEEEMTCAFLEMPQVIEESGILRCKLGLTKTAICLQVVLLNRNETDLLLQIGPEEFSYYLYPEDGSACHFLCELHRSERF